MRVTRKESEREGQRGRGREWVRESERGRKGGRERERAGYCVAASVRRFAFTDKSIRDGWFRAADAAGVSHAGRKGRGRGQGEGTDADPSPSRPAKSCERHLSGGGGGLCLAPDQSQHFFFCFFFPFSLLLVHQEVAAQRLLTPRKAAPPSHAHFIRTS